MTPSSSGPPTGGPVLSGSGADVVPTGEATVAQIWVRRLLLLLLLFLSAGWALTVAARESARADEVPPPSPVQFAPSPGLLPHPLVSLPTDEAPIPPMTGELPPADPAPADPVVEPTDPRDPVVEPAPPSDPVVEPTDPRDPVVEPAPPRDPVVEPTDPRDPVVEPAPPRDPVVEPADPRDPVVPPTVPTVPTVPDPGTALPVEPGPDTLPVDPGAVVPPGEETPTEPVPLVDDVVAGASSEVLAEDVVDTATDDVVNTAAMPEQTTSDMAPQLPPAVVCDEPAPVGTTVSAQSWPATAGAVHPTSAPLPILVPAPQAVPLGIPAAPDHPLPPPSLPPPSLPLAPAPAASTALTCGGGNGAHGDTDSAILPGNSVSNALPMATATGAADADQALRQSFQPGTRPD